MVNAQVGLQTTEPGVGDGRSHGEELRPGCTHSPLLLIVWGRQMPLSRFFICYAPLIATAPRLWQGAVGWAAG